MNPYELRIELTDAIVQELIWRALAPEAIAMMPLFNEALEQQQAQLGAPPEGAQIAGVSVISEEGRMYAELTYS